LGLSSDGSTLLFIVFSSGEGSTLAIDLATLGKVGLSIDELDQSGLKEFVIFLIRGGSGEFKEFKEMILS